MQKYIKKIKCFNDSSKIRFDQGQEKIRYIESGNMDNFQTIGNLIDALETVKHNMRSSASNVHSYADYLKSTAQEFKNKLKTPEAQKHLGSSAIQNLRNATEQLLARMKLIAAHAEVDIKLGSKNPTNQNPAEIITEFANQTPDNPDFSDAQKTRRSVYTETVNETSWYDSIPKIFPTIKYSGNIFLQAGKDHSNKSALTLACIPDWNEVPRGENAYLDAVVKSNVELPAPKMDLKHGL